MIKAHHRDQAEWLSAIGDPTRLALIRALSNGEMIVSDLAKAVKVVVPNVSQHLKIMKYAGIAAVERDGRRMRYSLLNMTTTAVEIVLTHDSGMKFFLGLSGETSEEPGAKKPAAKKGKK